MTDLQGKRQRHIAWLTDNHKRLSAEAREAHQQHGRGVWMVSERHSGNVVLDDDAITQTHYFDKAVITKMPDGPARRDLLRLVNTYNPESEYVICIKEEGDISIYRLQSEVS